MYNTFNTLNLVNYSPYELVFRRKLKMLLILDTMPDIEVLGTFKDYHELLNKTKLSSQTFTKLEIKKNSYDK